MASIKNVVHQALIDVLNTVCLAAAGLAEATTTAGAIQIANAIEYVIDGIFYSKAATDDIALARADGGTVVNIADGNAAILAILIDAAGDVFYAQGDAGVIGSNLYMPDIPAGYAVIGAIKVETSGADFVPGTTDLGAAEVTATYYDMMRDSIAAF
jgi:hypothetical protein